MSKFIVLLLVFICSCVEEQITPESALKSLVETRMGKIVSREEILTKVTGKMKASLENMNDVDFAKFADLSNIDRNSFKILSKSCQDKKCFLTYSIGYQTRQEKTAVFTSEVKKIAEILNVSGKWLISDVSNIKTYHESLEPINPLE